MLDPQLRKMMPHNVKISRKTGEDEYVQATFSAPRLVKCQITGEVKQVVTNTGEEATSTLTIILEKAVGVGPDDRIELPAPFTPKFPRILSVSRFPGEKTDGMFEVVYA